MLHLLVLLAATIPGDVGPPPVPAGVLRADTVRAAAGVPVDAAEARSAAPTLVLLRHAETQPDGTRDPALSDEGRARAALLAGLLSRAGVTEVWSTDLRRTRDTAAPLAEAAGVEVRTYDPFDPGALAGRLEGSRGTVVVVGHSNTTPAFVEAFGGAAGPSIAEDEHDRIYVLLPGPAGGAPRTLRLRY